MHGANSITRVSYFNLPRGGLIRGTFYEGLKEDPIAAITTALIENLRAERYENAKRDYRRLVDTITRRGNIGKDIRYAKRELIDLSREYEENRFDRLARIAHTYAMRLPSPQPHQRKGSAKYLRSNGANTKAKKAEVYTQRLPKLAKERRESHSNSKRFYGDKNTQYNLEYTLLRENWPQSAATFILNRLNDSGILIQIRERGLTLSGLMKYFEFYPGERSGKLYIVHNRVMNDVEGSYGKEISDPEQFFESEKYKDFPHVRLDDTTLALPRDVSDKPAKGIKRTKGYQIIIGKKKTRFINDLVSAELGW